MELRRIFFVYFIEFLCLAGSASGQVNELSNGGRIYSFGIPEGYTSTPNIILFISAKGTATVQVTAPFVRMDSTRIVKETSVSITLNRRLQVTGTTSANKGIIIKSDVDIYVHVLILDSLTSTDGFLAKPLDTNFNEFYVFTYKKTDRKNQFMVSVLTDNTDVRIMLKLSSGSVIFKGVRYSNGQTMRQVLNEYDTMQLQSDGDLTGTYITSSKPISVISGSVCMSINSACDITMDQLLPVTEWKTNYITSSMRGIMRIMAMEDNTIVKINNQEVTSLNKGKYYEKRISSAEMLSIQGSQPISVLQFYVISCPFMVIVPAIEQFMTSYNFEVPTDFVSNYLEVYVETDKIGGILIDGRVAAVTNRRSVTFQDTGLSYSAGRIAITEGKYKLTHAIPGTKFGALLYGLRSSTAYGFYLGYSNAPICTPSCQNNGTCLVGNTCHCQLGFRGHRCELGTALASELKPRLYTLVDGDDNNFMDPLAWYADPPISDTNKACYVKLLLQNSQIETIATAVSSTTDDVEYGNFTAGPIDSTAGVTGSTRFACLEVRCPFVTMDGDLRDTVVDVSLSGNNTEACRVSTHNNHVTNFTVQSEPSKSDKIHVILEVGKNYGPYYGVYMAIGKRDKAKFLAEHKCNSGHEYDYENYNPGTGILAEYIC